MSKFVDRSKYPEFPNGMCPMTIENCERYNVKEYLQNSFCSRASGGCSPICGEQFFETFGKRRRDL